jgi:hypothetical protein
VATYWFKQRRFGYGATPVTWQGWVFVLVFLAIVLACMGVVMLAGSYNSPAGAIAALVVLLAAIVVMMVVGWRKTEGGWRWRWGGE